MSGIPEYPWSDGELLYAEALNAAIAGATQAGNVLNYGADPTGVADSSPAFIAALATGSNVYAPAGTYRLNSAITVGGHTGEQCLRGDGLATVLLVDQSFSSSAAAVIVLGGADSNPGTLSDFWIRFIQPSTVTSRSTFLTLANGGTSGSGGTGIQYPPAVNISGRFKLRRLRISNCWDGLVATAGTGGWWMQDIEISPYNRGLVVLDNLDFAHIKGWHHWAFDMVGQQHAIQEDGNCYAMQFVGPSETQAINATDIAILHGRVLFNSPGGWAHFENVMLDGGSTLEHVNSVWTLFENVYFTPGATIGASAQLLMQGGQLSIVNFSAQSSSGQPFWAAQSGGRLSLGHGFLTTSAANQTFITQSGGILNISETMFIPGGSPWTIAPVQCTGGAINFVGNYVHTYSLAGAPVGFLQLSVDDPTNCVEGDWASTAYFTPPGSQGRYNLRRGPQNYNYGLQPTVGASYGATPTNMTLWNVTPGGGVHIGTNAVAVVIDSTQFSFGGAFSDNSAQGASNPASGSTVQIPNNCGLYTISTGNIASLTVILPINPINNQQLRIWSSGNITTFTLQPSPGQTLPATVTTLTANRSLLFLYANGPWLMLTGG